MDVEREEQFDTLPKAMVVNMTLMIMKMTMLEENEYNDDVISVL